MILRNSGYEELAERIKRKKSKIFIYGAGMIGQVVIPYIIENYTLYEYVECFVDMDQRKIGKKITIGNQNYEIKSPEVLKQIAENSVLLITNSKFYPIVDYLDSIFELENVEGYIIPIIQLQQQQIKIPKKIHYCWFSRKPMPIFLQECIESWKRICPDYEIICWNEDTYDVNKFTYTRQAYEKQRFGFVTDVARLDILYQHGGIYFDTDVKLLKRPDTLLCNEGFIGVEKWGNINTGGGVGAVAGHPMIKEMLDERLKYPFIYEDGSLNTETNGLYETMPFIRHGMKIKDTLQRINGMTVYPSSVFHPYDYMSCEEKIEPDTISVHYFFGGWMEEEDKKNRMDTQHRYAEIMRRMK